MEQDEKERRNRVESMAATGQALVSLANAVGVVLIVVRRRPGSDDPDDMDVQVASAFHGRELLDAEMRDLLRTAATMETFH